MFPPGPAIIERPGVRLRPDRDRAHRRQELLHQLGQRQVVGRALLGPRSPPRSPRRRQGRHRLQRVTPLHGYPSPSGGDRPRRLPRPGAAILYAETGPREAGRPDQDCRLDPSLQPLLEQGDDGGLLGAEVGQPLGELLLGPSLEGLEHRAVEVGLDHLGVDVALPADRGRVAQPLGDVLDGPDDVLLGLRLRVERLELAERQRGQDGPGPGPEVLGGELAAGGLADVLVDVGRVDRPGLTLLVQVLEQLLAREVPAPADDPGEPGVGQVDLVLDPALAPELEPDRLPADPDVPVAHRGQAERLVGPGVFLVADPDQGRLQEPDDRRQHLLARQPGRARSASVRFRIAGNAEANAIIRPYFDSSRTVRHRGW